MMEIKIIKEKISRKEFKRIAEENFGDMVKAVVDVERGILALGGELHIDGEILLWENGSKSENLWGINIYADEDKDKRVGFIALINIRPARGNRSMEVQDPKIREKIKEIVDKLIE
ncbi:MAG: DUF5674 family protein [bacterium]|nr:DUF5674 family protein [bacterium]